MRPTSGPWGWHHWPPQLELSAANVFTDTICPCKFLAPNTLTAQGLTEPCLTRAEVVPAASTPQERKGQRGREPCGGMGT